MKWLKKLMERVFGPRCADPKAPWVSCYRCGIKLKTCEREEAADYDYTCPRHKDGIEAWPGKWICIQCSGRNLP